MYDVNHPVDTRYRGLMRSAAFFDLDKTILAKSSSFAFAKPFYRNGLIGRAVTSRVRTRLARSPWTWLATVVTGELISDSAGATVDVRHGKCVGRHR